MIVSWQSDLVYTKVSILSVCDQSYHMNKENVQKEEEFWRFMELCIIYRI